MQTVCEVLPQIRRLQAVVFVMTLALVLPSPVYPYFFTSDLALSSAQYGQVVGATSLTHLGAAICYGRLSDVIGRRRVIIFQCTLSTILYSTLAHLSYYTGTVSRAVVCPALVTVFIALGFCNTVNLLTCSAVCDLCTKFPHTSSKLTNNTLAQHRPKFLAQVAGVLGLAGVFGPLLGQGAQALGGDPSRPTVCWALSACASATGLLIAFTVTETNPNAQSPTYYIKLARDWALGAPTMQHSSPLLSELSHCDMYAGTSTAEICLPHIECEMARNVVVVSSRDTSSGPAITQLSTPIDALTPHNGVVDQAVPENVPPPPASVTPISSSEPFTPPSIFEIDFDEAVDHREEELKAMSTADMWIGLTLTYLCQAVKALSLSTISVCYGLVLDAMLPSGWFFGLNRTQVLALGLACASLVRVAIQLVYFQRFLKGVGGPARAFLVGTVCMSFGQLSLYWTLRYLPAHLGLLDHPNPANTLIFATLHFLTVGGIFAVGLAVGEPALTTLIALCVSDHPSYQGTAQGLNSASNLLGATVGPPIFGWLLGARSSSTSGAAKDRAPTPLPPLALESAGGDGSVGAVAPDFVVGSNPATMIDEDSMHQPRSFPAMFDKLWSLSADEHLVVGANPLPAMDIPSSPPSGGTYDRAGMVFYTGAVVALLPLLWGRKLRKIAKNWQSH